MRHRLETLSAAIGIVCLNLGAFGIPALAMVGIALFTPTMLHAFAGLAN